MNNAILAALLEQYGCGGFQRDYPVKNPKTGRNFKIDFAYALEKVAVEYEGGLYQRGFHTSIAEYSRNCRKYNLLALTGWRLLRFTAADMPGDIIGQVKDALGRSKG